MLTQQLEDADVLPHAAPGTMSLFESRSEFAKDRRKLPMAIDVGVIQGCRASGKRHQVMQGIENLVAGVVAAHMAGHDLVTVNDLDAVDVALDGHILESDGARDAVAHVVEPHELVLVDFRRLPNAGVEAPVRQDRCVLPLMGQLLGNRATRVA